MNHNCQCFATASRRIDRPPRPSPAAAMTALASSPPAVAGEERVDDVESLTVEQRLKKLEGQFEKNDAELLKVKQQDQKVWDAVEPLAGLATQHKNMASQLEQRAAQLAVVTSSIADTFAAYRHEAAVSYSRAFLPSLHLLLATPPASFQKEKDAEITKRNLRRILGTMEGVQITAHGKTYPAFTSKGEAKPPQTAQDLEEELQGLVRKYWDKLSP
ncbi:hypothetical protein JCM10296v2_002090 [Rhodotorula toruloides]